MVVTGGSTDSVSVTTHESRLTVQTIYNPKTVSTPKQHVPKQRPSNHQKQKDLVCESVRPSHCCIHLYPRFPVPSSHSPPSDTLQQVSHTSVTFKVRLRCHTNAASPPPFRSCLLSAWHAPVAARAWRCLRVLDVSQAKTETATLCHGWLLCRSTLALVLTEVVIVLPASRCGRHGQPMLEKDIRQR